MIIFLRGEENRRPAEWAHCSSNWQDINGIYYAGLPNRDCLRHKAASISRVLALTGWFEVTHCLTIYLIDWRPHCMQWIPLIGMFAHVQFPQPPTLGQVCLNSLPCLVNTFNLNYTVYHFAQDRCNITFPDL